MHVIVAVPGVTAGVTVAVDGFPAAGATATDSLSDVHSYEISVALSGIFTAVAVSVPLPPLSKTVSSAGSMVTLGLVEAGSTTVTVRLT